MLAPGTAGRTGEAARLNPEGCPDRVHRLTFKDVLVFPMTISPTVAKTLFQIGVAACAIAQFFILRAVFRTLPAAPASDSVPSPIRWAEVFWVIIPVFALAGALWGTWRALP